MEVDISIPKEYLEKSGAFQLGYLFRLNNVSKKDNPFDPWTHYQNWMNWQTGWYQALEDRS
jgi:ribosome modulation factor